MGKLVITQVYLTEYDIPDVSNIEQLTIENGAIINARTGETIERLVGYDTVESVALWHTVDEEGIKYSNGEFSSQSNAQATDPYLTTIEVTKQYHYNPQYGDDRLCECGHTYERHFDTYDNMATSCCKYCGCQEFKEK